MTSARKRRLDADYMVAREAALLRDLGRCVACGRDAEQTQHRVPRSRAAPDIVHALPNLLSICARCHRALHDVAPADAARFGLVVKSGYEPEDVPVMRGCMPGGPWSSRPRPLWLLGVIVEPMVWTWTWVSDLHAPPVVAVKGWDSHKIADEVRARRHAAEAAQEREDQ
jgi:hypothetical protein